MLAANLMAMLVQSLSAKLGIATGQNLAEVCRDRFPRPVTWFLWVQAEVVAMATDLAEFVGAALGLAILFDMPLFLAGTHHGGRRLRGARAPGTRLAARRGRDRRAGGRDRRLVRDPGLPGAGLRIAAPLHGVLVPSLPNSEATLLAVGIIGATVMPHVIYLHSALTQRRIVGVDEEARRKIFRFELDRRRHRDGHRRGDQHGDAGRRPLPSSTRAG